ncbi:MAG: RsmB/NOP family class I SAM-dependent RNA methyltransferase [Pseudorhodobacter sp.]|nr:RsmB/NOP family class I SAM-dependent RNA methyltransferase [Pseudorhodobacter sp.]
MTPAARIAAAIDILDRELRGEAAEAVLTAWARGNRFAGSGDRAAIRDLVYDALRRRSSYAALGGSLTGRGLLLGQCFAQGIDPDTVFTGDKFAPAVLGAAERGAGVLPEGLHALDCPAWIAPQLQEALGADFAAVMAAQRERAPVFLRVNLARMTRAEVQAALAADGIGTEPDDHVKTALKVTENARKVRTSSAYLSGLVELQDLSSQSMVEMLPVHPGAAVLDYCAGGGGKVLAMAARVSAHYVAHDIDAARMIDLPRRAARAGAQVAIAQPGKAPGGQDLVLVDAPCSGSGTWRRNPEAKWRLTPERLAELTGLQAQILGRAAALVQPGGTLAYMTCSLLTCENGAQIAGFLREISGWTLRDERRLTPLSGGDGFYLALMTRQ